ncbi:surfeit locus protein 6 homolog [Onthophagus taurus]|uniref:surfeit locus protein 6 homolog n=1 Tax=Onthophagus taurus TaxID=166361 RepID=UPI000C2003D5|nr:surfeit locus protein 6 homolog [Onthophagus taurus]
MTELNKKSKPKLNKVEKILQRENVFIKDLYNVLCLPTIKEENNELEDDLLSKKPNFNNSKTTRAKSLVDLQERINKLKNKSNSNYKQQLQKKHLKNRLKKKIKQENRNKQTKIKSEPTIKLENGDNKELEKTKTMVFSKINFDGLGNQKKKKMEKDPKKILEKVEDVNKKVAELKSVGETKKAIEIREKTAWKNALAKAEGIKVKDDPVLLKKSIKKNEQKKKSSQKKWEARIQGVEKAKDERQKKRTENIEKRQKEKKVTKLKKAAKRGKIIPGF